MEHLTHKSLTEHLIKGSVGLSKLLLMTFGAAFNQTSWFPLQVKLVDCLTGSLSNQPPALLNLIPVLLNSSAVRMCAVLPTSMDG